MPANPKYLEKSNWRKFVKLFIGIVGGYIISALVHLLLVIVLQPYHIEALITMRFTFYTLWVVLMLLSYFIKKAWLIYLSIIVVLVVIYFIVKHNNPFI